VLFATKRYVALKYKEKIYTAITITPATLYRTNCWTVKRPTKEYTQ